MQGCNSHRGDGLRAWDGYWTLSASRLTLLLVTMSLIPGHWPWNADAGASSERERIQMELGILLLSLLIFLPPSVRDHDTHWLHNTEQGGHSKYFSSNITNYVFYWFTSSHDIINAFPFPTPEPLSLSQSMNTFCVAVESYLIVTFCNKWYSD